MLSKIKHSKNQLEELNLFIKLETAEIVDDGFFYVTIVFDQQPHCFFV